MSRLWLKYWKALIQTTPALYTAETKRSYQIACVLWKRRRGKLNIGGTKITQSWKNLRMCQMASTTRSQTDFIYYFLRLATTVEFSAVTLKTSSHLMVLELWYLLKKEMGIVDKSSLWERGLIQKRECVNSFLTGSRVRCSGDWWKKNLPILDNIALFNWF